MANWMEVDPTRYGSLPDEPGCYAIYLDGILAYIGQSTSIRKRLSQHKIRYGYGSHIHTPWGPSKLVQCKVRLSRRYGDWAMVELRLIKRLQPPMNCVGSVKKASRRVHG